MAFESDLILATIAVQDHEVVKQVLTSCDHKSQELIAANFDSMVASIINTDTQSAHSNAKTKSKCPKQLKNITAERLLFLFTCTSDLFLNGSPERKLDSKHFKSYGNFARSIASFCLAKSDLLEQVLDFIANKSISSKDAINFISTLEQGTISIVATDTQSLVDAAVHANADANSMHYAQLHAHLLTQLSPEIKTKLSHVKKDLLLDKDLDIELLGAASIYSLLTSLSTQDQIDFALALKSKDLYLKYLANNVMQVLKEHDLVHLKISSLDKALKLPQDDDIFNLVISTPSDELINKAISSSLTNGQALNTAHSGTNFGAAATNGSFANAQSLGSSTNGATANVPHEPCTIYKSVLAKELSSLAELKPHSLVYGRNLALYECCIKRDIAYLDLDELETVIFAQDEALFNAVRLLSDKLAAHLPAALPRAARVDTARLFVIYALLSSNSLSEIKLELSDGISCKLKEHQVLNACYSDNLSIFTPRIVEHIKTLICASDAHNCTITSALDSDERADTTSTNKESADITSTVAKSLDSGNEASDANEVSTDADSDADAACNSVDAAKDADFVAVSVVAAVDVCCVGGGDFGRALMRSFMNALEVKSFKELLGKVDNSLILAPKCLFAALNSFLKVKFAFEDERYQLISGEKLQRNPLENALLHDYLTKLSAQSNLRAAFLPTCVKVGVSAPRSLFYCSNTQLSQYNQSKEHVAELCYELLSDYAQSSDSVNESSIICCDIATLATHGSVTADLLVKDRIYLLGYERDLLNHSFHLKALSESYSLKSIAIVKPTLALKISAFESKYTLISGAMSEELLKFTGHDSNETELDKPTAADKSACTINTLHGANELKGAADAKHHSSSSVAANDESEPITTSDSGAKLLSNTINYADNILSIETDEARSNVSAANVESNSDFSYNSDEDDSEHNEQDGSEQESELSSFKSAASLEECDSLLASDFIDAKNTLIIQKLDATKDHEAIAIYQAEHNHVLEQLLYVYDELICHIPIPNCQGLSAAYAAKGTLSSSSSSELSKSTYTGVSKASSAKASSADASKSARSAKADKGDDGKAFEQESRAEQAHSSLSSLELKLHFVKSASSTLSDDVNQIFDSKDKLRSILKQPLLNTRDRYSERMLAYYISEQMQLTSKLLNKLGSDAAKANAQAAAHAAAHATANTSAVANAVANAAAHATANTSAVADAAAHGAKDDITSGHDGSRGHVGHGNAVDKVGLDAAVVSGANGALEACASDLAMRAIYIIAYAKDIKATALISRALKLKLEIISLEDIINGKVDFASVYEQLCLEAAGLSIPVIIDNVCLEEFTSLQPLCEVLGGISDDRESSDAIAQSISHSATLYPHLSALGEHLLKSKQRLKSLAKGDVDCLEPYYSGDLSLSAMIEGVMALLKASNLRKLGTIDLYFIDANLTLLAALEDHQRLSCDKDYQDSFMELQLFSSMQERNHILALVKSFISNEESFDTKQALGKLDLLLNNARFNNQQSMAPQGSSSMGAGYGSLTTSTLDANARGRDNGMGSVAPFGTSDASSHTSYQNYEHAPRYAIHEHTQSAFSDDIMRHAPNNNFDARGCNGVHESHGFDEGRDFADRDGFDARGRNGVHESHGFDEVRDFADRDGLGARGRNGVHENHGFDEGRDFADRDGLGGEHQSEELADLDDEGEKGEQALKRAMGVISKLFIGGHEWHSYQKDALPHILSKRNDYLISIPTGGGKSVLFQGPALYRANFSKRLSIVVSPLKALIHDQIVELRNKGFTNADYLSSDRDYRDIQDSYASILSGKTHILYVTPERFRSRHFFATICARFQRDGGGEYLVFDEAHCISQWGKDFRPDYLNAAKICRVLRQCFDLSIIMCSATMTTQVSNELMAYLNNPLRLGESSDNYNPIREHIKIQMRQVSDDFESRISAILNFINEENIDFTKSRMIIFCQTRKTCEKVSNALEAAAYKFIAEKTAYRTNYQAPINYDDLGPIAKLAGHVDFFHAGLYPHVRKRLFERFKDNHDSKDEGAAVAAAASVAADDGNAHAAKQDLNPNADNQDLSISAVNQALIAYAATKDKAVAKPIYVLCSTKAFGMGMDIPNIHYVVHFSPPSVFEDYLQEVGRAGRDMEAYFKAFPNGDKIPALCLYCQRDFEKANEKINDNLISWNQLISADNSLRCYIQCFRSLEATQRSPVLTPIDVVSRSKNKILIPSSTSKSTQNRLLLSYLEELGRICTQFSGLCPLPIRINYQKLKEHLSKIKIAKNYLISEESFKSDLYSSTDENTPRITISSKSSSDPISKLAAAALGLTTSSSDDNAASSHGSKGQSSTDPDPLIVRDRDILNQDARSLHAFLVGVSLIKIVDQAVNKSLEKQAKEKQSKESKNSADIAADAQDTASSTATVSDVIKAYAAQHTDASDSADAAVADSAKAAKSHSAAASTAKSANASKSHSDSASTAKSADADSDDTDALALSGELEDDYALRRNRLIASDADQLIDVAKLSRECKLYNTQVINALIELKLNDTITISAPFSMEFMKYRYQEVGYFLNPHNFTFRQNEQYIASHLPTVHIAIQVLRSIFKEGYSTYLSALKREAERYEHDRHSFYRAHEGSSFERFEQVQYQNSDQAAIRSAQRAFNAPNSDEYSLSATAPAPSYASRGAQGKISKGNKVYRNILITHQKCLNLVQSFMLPLLPDCKFYEIKKVRKSNKNNASKNEHLATSEELTSEVEQFMPWFDKENKNDGPVRVKAYIEGLATHIFKLLAHTASYLPGINVSYDKQRYHDVTSANALLLEVSNNAYELFLDVMNEDLISIIEFLHSKTLQSTQGSNNVHQDLINNYQQISPLSEPALANIDYKAGKLESPIVENYSWQDNWCDVIHMLGLMHKSASMLKNDYVLKHSREFAQEAYQKISDQIYGYNYFRFILDALGTLKFTNSSSLMSFGIEVFTLDGFQKEIDAAETPQSPFYDKRKEFELIEKFRRLRISIMQLFCEQVLENQRSNFIKSIFQSKNSDDFVKNIAKFSNKNSMLLQQLQAHALELEESKLTDNQEQWQIYTAPLNQNINVMAGPGSGKTHILTMRAARLVYREHVSPESILVLAYNRAVVIELKNRLGTLFSELGMPRLGRRIKVFTFHGLAKRCLQGKLNDVDTSSWEQALANALQYEPQLFTSIFPRLEYIMIDEFQDITATRLVVLNLIVSQYHDLRLFTIGDINQSIYGFDRINNRDSNKLISVQEYAAKLRPEPYYYYLEQRFKPVTMSLTRNYRSYPDILKLASEFLKDKTYLPVSDPKIASFAPKHEYARIYDLTVDPSNLWYELFKHTFDFARKKNRESKELIYKGEELLKSTLQEFDLHLNSTRTTASPMPLEHEQRTAKALPELVSFADVNENDDPTIAAHTIKALAPNHAKVADVAAVDDDLDAAEDVDTSTGAGSGYGAGSGAGNGETDLLKEGLKAISQLFTGEDDDELPDFVVEQYSQIDSSEVERANAGTHANENANALLKADAATTVAVQTEELMLRRQISESKKEVNIKQVMDDVSAEIELNNRKQQAYDLIKEGERRSIKTIALLFRTNNDVYRGLSKIKHSIPDYVHLHIQGGNSLAWYRERELYEIANYLYQNRYRECITDDQLATLDSNYLSANEIAEVASNSDTEQTISHSHDAARQDDKDLAASDEALASDNMASSAESHAVRISTAQEIKELCISLMHHYPKWDKVLLDIAYCTVLSFMDSLEENEGELRFEHLYEYYVDILGSDDGGQIFKLYERYAKQRILGQDNGHEESLQVVMTTMHKVKGLEFDLVMVVPTLAPLPLSEHMNVINPQGFKRSHYPDAKTAAQAAQNIPLYEDELADFDEERRLYYVAYTRARKYLRAFKAFREKALDENRRYIYEREQSVRFSEKEPQLDHYFISFTAQANNFGINDYIRRCVKRNDSVMLQLIRINNANNGYRQRGYQEQFVCNILHRIDEHSKPCIIGRLSQKNPIFNAMIQSNVEFLDGLFISNIATWSYQDTLNSDERRANEALANHQKEPFAYSKLWCNDAKNAGFVYVIMLAGYGKVVTAN